MNVWNIPKREYSGDIKWFMEEEYSWKKIRYLLHNTSKDQRGLRGYRRQHHDTKWNIYSRRDHLIQSNICKYIRATNPTTLALFTIHLGRFLALVYPYFGKKWVHCIPHICHFFTQAKFLENKIYTEKRVNYDKIHRKLPTFALLRQNTQ